VIDIPAPTPEVIAENAADTRTNVASDDDRNRINDVLHQYELAYNTKNADALWKIWPGAPIERQQPIESYFRNAQSIRTVLQMGTPEIAADHLTATVTGKNNVSYTPKAGSKPPDAKGAITFTLKKDSSGGWTIAAIEYR
jgi:ketosteroid isomerase-like protein